VVLLLGVGAACGEPKPPPAQEPPASVAVAPEARSEPAAPAPDAAPPPPIDAPPRPQAAPRPDDWIDIAAAIPDAVIDMRYAAADNFTGTVLYPVARCLLRRAVADRLVVAAAALRAHDRRLLLWDCYRPAALQQTLWERVKDPRYVAKPVFAADGTPVSGSRHSRGAAIDVGLVDAAGAAVVLPTPHDDFTRAAHRKAAAKSTGKAELAILDAALEGAGFIGLPTEWWHYDAPDAARFPLADVPLDTPTAAPTQKNEQL
jgi:zinc D-Ala-D-Ala dipeptidase